MRPQIDEMLRGVRQEVDSFIRENPIRPPSRPEVSPRSETSLPASEVWSRRERELALIIRNRAQGGAYSVEERAQLQTARVLTAIAALVAQTRELHPADPVRRHEVLRLAISNVSFFRENSMIRAGVEPQVRALVLSLGRLNTSNGQSTEAIEGVVGCNCLQSQHWAVEWRDLVKGLNPLRDR